MMPLTRFSTWMTIGAFWIWCALLSYPLLSLKVDLVEAWTEYYSIATENSVIVISQIAGLALFVLAVFVSQGFRVQQAVGRLSTTALGILAIFFLSLVCQLRELDMPALMGIVYTLLLVITSVSLCVVWALPGRDLEICLTGAAVVLCSFGVVAIAALGWPDGRSVGNIHPNGFAAPLLASFILSQFRRGWIGVVVRVLSFAMVTLVSSRFAMAGCAAAFLLHQATLDPFSPGKIAAAILLPCVVVLFWPVISGVLALDDPDRGLTSGISGRDDLWQHSLEAIAEHPFGIGFKRTMIGEEGGHNGYLKTVLEFGIVGGGVLITFLLSIIVATGIEAVMTLGRDRRDHQFACARFGGLAALGLGAFFQPQLLSLGDAFSLSLLFLMFRPRLAAASLLARTPNDINPRRSQPYQPIAARPAE
ncbi:O-antigen ligase family protein [Bradyrhizobium sp. HKCCYLS3077]|uniref:O-antigen ligase family protein n=1 Tax=Bradyrhizobium sp. HKCCYLS3077 TaxID=3420761 RepID=UPI003EB9923F